MNGNGDAIQSWNSAHKKQIAAMIRPRRGPVDRALSRAASLLSEMSGRRPLSDARFVNALLSILTRFTQTKATRAQ